MIVPVVLSDKNISVFENLILKLEELLSARLNISRYVNSSSDVASIITVKVIESELNLGETLDLPISLEVKLPLEQSILSVPLSILILNFDHSNDSSALENERSKRFRPPRRRPENQARI